MTPAAPLSAWLDRLALALLTESSGGYIYANDGSSYPPDSAVCAVLRRSLALPYDKVWHDARSTGPLQQMSTEANLAMVPPVTWGWGSIADTMDPARAALMFLKSTRVTNDPVYVNVDGAAVVTSDPIVADVLRTQRPKVPAVLPPDSNYRPAQVALAKRMARGGNRFWTDGGK